MPVSECEFQLNSILDDLEPEPWHVPSDERNSRCTGTALNLAISLLEAVPKMGARIMSLLGGPCTIGPGTVVGVKLKEFIRAHHDIINATNNCKYMANAKKYYDGLTQRCMTNNITVDFFAFTLDQFGLVEMQTLPKQTGGYIIFHELFDSPMF